MEYEFDVTGLWCPEPVMLLHQKIRNLLPGDTLRVVATDPATERDIPKFCAFLGHELLYQENDCKQYIYIIRKGAAKN